MPTATPAMQGALAAPQVSSRPAATEVPDNTPVGTPGPNATEHIPQRLVPPAVGAGAGVAAAIIGVAGTALVLRRRHPRPGRTQPESDVTVNAGYAEAEPIEEIGPGAEGDDLSTAALIATRMSREVAAVLHRLSLDEAELPVIGARLAAVRHGRSSTTLLLQDVPMAARQQLIEALPEAATSAFGARSDVEGVVSVDGDVLVRLTGVASNASAVGPAGSSNGPEAWSAPSMLLRLGLLADREFRRELGRARPRTRSSSFGTRSRCSTRGDAGVARCPSISRGSRADRDRPSALVAGRTTGCFSCAGAAS